MSGLDQISFGPAYTWARTYGITTEPFSSARLDSQILRYEFAKMMMAYIQNVEGKTLEEKEECDIYRYGDYNSMSPGVRDIVQKACNTGLMGWRSEVGVNQTITTLLPRFRPFDILTTDELRIVASRYVPSTFRVFPTNNTRSAVIRFLYSISPDK